MEVVRLDSRDYFSKRRVLHTAPAQVVEIVSDREVVVERRERLDDGRLPRLTGERATQPLFISDRDVPGADCRDGP